VHEQSSIATGFGRFVGKKTGNHPTKMSAREATLCCSGFIFLTFIFVKVLSENVEENVFAFSNNGDCSSIKQAFNGIEMAVSFFKVMKLEIKQDKL